MQETLTLRNPIMIDGKEVTELTYDTNEITVDMFKSAAVNSVPDKSYVNKYGAAEVDYNFQLYLGFYAVIAINQDIDVGDLERAKGYDQMQFYNIGRNFTAGVSGEPSEQNSSDDVSEITPALLVHPSEKLDDEN